MTAEEFKKQLLESESAFFRFNVRIGITNIKLLGKDALGNWSYRIRSLNPFHPLSYLVVIVASLIGLGAFLVDEIIPELKKAFRYE